MILIIAKKLFIGLFLYIGFFFLFINKKHKNCLQFESSIKESKVTGFVALIKKVLLSRISIALLSGKLQTDVFK